VGGDISVDSETLLVIDFVNRKIKSAQFFRGAHKGRVCVRVFIQVSARTCMSIYVCTVFLKKKYVFDFFRKRYIFKILFKNIYILNFAVSSLGWAVYVGPSACWAKGPTRQFETLPARNGPQLTGRKSI
jgi:hypothetical protein